MVNLTIDNIPVVAQEDMTILEAAALVHIKIPTLCYLKGICEIGACRVCVVEVEGNNTLCASCNTKVAEGMVVSTNSSRVINARKINTQLILSQHESNCMTCVRSSNCKLQKLANDLNLIHTHYVKNIEKNKWDQHFPMIRDSSKCIKCYRCVNVCENIQTLNVWDVIGTGSRMTVNIPNRRPISKSNCTLCGQCITHCPVGALRERDDTENILEAFLDPEKIVIAQIAPAVLTAWIEGFNISKEKQTVNRLVAAVSAIGFDYVFGTDYTADMTIMEEGSEFLKKLVEDSESDMPLFTSCCPGWVSFVKTEYPQLLKNLSTAKSPQQMFGAIAKSYYAKLLSVDPSKIYCVSIMPCVSKKREAALDLMDDENSTQYVDTVITTRELDRMLKMKNIDIEALTEREFDKPFGAASGAGTIFGATGGVMEAALRTAYKILTGNNPDPDAFKNVRGMEGWKDAEFEINGRKIKIAVVSGLGNTRKLVEAILSEKVKYDFVEVMACPGGCCGGGGQPIKDGCELSGVRSNMLYDIDRSAKERFSHENPAVIKSYEDFFGEPLSELSHELLHTKHIILES